MVYPHADGTPPFTFLTSAAWPRFLDFLRVNHLQKLSSEASTACSSSVSFTKYLLSTDGILLVLIGPAAVLAAAIASGKLYRRDNEDVKPHTETQRALFHGGRGNAGIDGLWPLETFGFRFQAGVDLCSPALLKLGTLLEWVCQVISPAMARRGVFIPIAGHCIFRLLQARVDSEVRILQYYYNQMSAVSFMSSHHFRVRLNA